MVINMQEYIDSLKNRNISISYNGPLWEDGIISMADMLKSQMSQQNLPKRASKTVFSVFVEQMTNMLMYSAGREKYGQDGNDEVPTGMLVLGQKDNSFFIQTGNEIHNYNAEHVKKRIDYLNTLDKDELRQHNKERLRGENDNPDSKGAGLGLIEIARRVTAPISYTIEPINDELSYFSMYVEIAQEDE